MINEKKDVEFAVHIHFVSTININLLAEIAGDLLTAITIDGGCNVENVVHLLSAIIIEREGNAKNVTDHRYAIIKEANIIVKNAMDLSIVIIINEDLYVKSAVDLRSAHMEYAKKIVKNVVGPNFVNLNGVQLQKIQNTMDIVGFVM